jgi:hypothetical protein
MGYLKYTVHIGTNVLEEPDVCIKYRGSRFICQLNTHPLKLHDGNVIRHNFRTQDVNGTTILKRILNKWVKGCTLFVRFNMRTSREIFCTRSWNFRPQKFHNDFLLPAERLLVLKKKKCFHALSYYVIWLSWITERDKILFVTNKLFLTFTRLIILWIKQRITTVNTTLFFI